jgi:NADH-quinone oxidoreductase subunit H
MKLGMFLFAEYINMFISCTVISCLYFGGYHFPGLDPNWLGGLMGPVILLSKSFFFIFVFMWIRWTLPRFRYDQLMGLGWSGLIPLAMFNIVVTGLGVLLDQQILIGIGGVVVFIAGIVVYDQLFVKKKIA